MPPSRTSRRSTGRTNASSPDGSHAASSPAPPVAPLKEKGQSSLDSWIEPPVRAPVASFEEAGFERQGVLSTMMPLGVKPTAKDRARSRVDGLRRSAAGRNGHLSGAEDSRDTPDVDGAQQAEDRERNPQEYLPVLPPNKDEEEDDDYMPAVKKKKGKKSKGHKRLSKSETPATSARQTAAPSTPENPSLSPSPEDPVSNGVSVYVEKAVRGALARATSSGRESIGAALHRLDKQSKHDKALADLLDAVAKNGGKAPSKEQHAAFERYVKRAKRGSPEGQGDEPTQRSPKRARTPRGPAGLALTPTQSARSLSPASPTKSTAINTTSSATHTPAPDDLPSERTVTPPKETSAKGMNGMSSSALHSQRSRSGSISSLSSLSSVDESIAAGPPPDPVIAKPLPAPMNGVFRTGVKPKKPFNKKASATATGKRSPDDAGLTESEDEDTLAKRQKYHEMLPDIASFNDNMETSSIRPDRSKDLSDVKPGPVLAPPRKQTLKLTNGLLKKSALQASSSTASPLSEGFPTRGSGPATRATTPSLNADGGERPAKRQKTSARTKHSPIKNRSGGVAGVARASGGMESPIGYDDNDARSENDDFCSACGFSGLLLCCDGCDKAFHLTCCDPPLNDTPDSKWLCHLCTAKSNPAAKDAPFRLFGPLMGTMNRRNPTVFALPKRLQDHFEGVRADNEGAYEEVSATKPLNKGRGGWDEVPDNTKLMDAKGNAILCTQCGKSSLNKQQIIQCDECNAHWHLECLDPPMSNPPPIPFNSRHRNVWRCPRHIDRDLRSIEPTVSSALGSKRIFRIRRPKNPKVLDANMKRGFKNIGLIEIHEDSSDSEKEFTEVGTDDDDGVVYRLPAQGIKLDFIQKVKEMQLARQKATARKVITNMVSRPKPVYDAKFSKASAADRRASVNLVQLANRESDLGISGDALQTLIYSLNAESPDEVVQDMTAAETAPSTGLQPPTEEERRQLLALQELIRRRLGGTNGSVARRACVTAPNATAAVATLQTRK